VRSETEENAKFLSLPIHDEKSSSTRIREVDLLGGSIKGKFKKVWKPTRFRILLLY